MSYLYKELSLSKINKIEIYVTKCTKTLAQVKSETKADYIINAGMWNSDLTPCPLLKVNGVMLSDTPWAAEGHGWNGPNDFGMIVDYTKVSNFIAVTPLINNATPLSKLYYDTAQGGKRGRSAIGTKGDKLCLYCSQDGTSDAKTPETLRNYLYNRGWESATMLDGGGSSQCDFNGLRIKGDGRKCHNWILVYCKKEGNNTVASSKKKVVLDAGHGIETAGKRSPDGTYRECEFALDMANRIKPILERHGVEVTLTRTDEHDITIAKRYQIANSITDLNLFVSLHSNAAGSGADWMSARGYGIYTSTGPETAERNVAAKAVIARAKEAGLQLWGNGLFYDSNKGISVLWKTNAPAILIEHLFHDNREDVALLKDSSYRDKLAEVDAKGILDYFGIAWQNESTTGGNQSSDENNTSSSTSNVADWAKDSWTKATNKGVFDGTRPTENITRQEVAVVLDRCGLLD